MTYKGLFKPKNPSKYKGNINEIVYRSSWEKKIMIYCDTTKSVVEWGSEELIIPYISPWDGRYHRYFPDFYVKVKDRSGKLQKYIIEVKPKHQCTPPEKTPKRRTGKWFSKVKTWGINKAKWKSAQEFCESHGMQFKILTEDHLNPR